MINANGILIEKHYESLNDGDLKMIGLQPKMDACGIWTEGWGHAMTDVHGNFIKGIANKTLAYSLNKVTTEQQADTLLIADNKIAELFVRRHLTVEVIDNMLSALIVHTMNTGGSHDLISLVNQQSPSLFDWWCNHYITGQGKPLLGLKYRRKTEAIFAIKGVIQYFN
jgi:GH24 family phage-related lysozyme (muramidase)